MQNYKIYTKGNYIFFEWMDSSLTSYKKRYTSSKIIYQKDKEIFILSYENKTVFTSSYLNIVKEDNSPYTEIELETFLNENTSLNETVSNSTTNNITQISGINNPITTPNSTTAGIPVRQIPDLDGNTQIIGNTVGTSINVKLSDSTTSLPIILPNTSVTLSSPTIPVQVSGNSPMMSPLAPSTVATRHQIIGGQFLGVSPTLTNLQQAPFRLSENGSLYTENITKPTLQFGGFGIADLAITGIIKNISVTNTTASGVYIQIHSKVSELLTLDVPFNAKSYRVPSNSTVFFGTADLGSMLVTNCRVGLSTTFNTYTAVPLTATSFGLNIETI